MPPHDPYIGQDLGPYHINATLGQGGMSVVYKAWDKGLNRPVAIKLLHRFLASNDECRQRLAREAQTVAKLQHPNIVQIYGYAELSSPEENTAYLATEFVPGKTLKDFIGREPITGAPEIAADITLKIARALAYAHSKGVIHRDIKPENIMVHEDGLLKLMDFGIAQVQDQTSLTVTGALLGSPAHMAPEIIEGKEASEKTDIFSLITVFYWLLTDNLPFVGDNPHVLMRRIVEEQYVAPEEANLAVPRELGELIKIGLKREPKDRIDLYQLIQRLEEFLTNNRLAQLRPDLHSFLTEPSESYSGYIKRLNSMSMETASLAISQKNNSLASYFINRILLNDPENQRALELLPKAHVSTQKRSYKRKLYLALFMCVPIAAGIFFAQKTESLPLHLNNSSGQYSEMSWEIISQALSPKKISPPQKSQKPAPPLQKLPGYEIEFLVNPYADVYVDNVLIGKNQKSLTAELKPGMRKIEFRHRYAQSKTILVNATGSNKTLPPAHIILSETKPSKLIFNSNLSADVIIDGNFMGTTLDSTAYPFEVPMPDKNSSKMVEIIVSKKGYIPFITKTKLVAGVLSQINVTLIPEV